MWNYLCLCFLGITNLAGLVDCLQKFTVVPVDTAVIQGQTATLNCTVVNRVGIIQWAKDGFLLGFDKTIPGFPTYSVIQGSPDQYNLMITDTTLRDDAEFECQVGPATGNPPLQASAYLTIQVPPDLPEILGHNNGTTVDIPYTQHMINLTCLVRNGRPAASIQWYRNNVLITDGIENSTEPIIGDKKENSRSIITIRTGRHQQGAVYKCTAFNAALKTPFQTHVTLNMLYRPSKPTITGYAEGQGKKVGDVLRLVCISTGGNPAAQVVWFRNNEKIDFSYDSGNNRSENDLTFTVARRDNNAIYRCEASNPVTPQPLTTQVQLTVYFPPVKTTISGNKLAKAGEQIELTCESSNSNPAAVITWFSRGRQYAETQNEVTPTDDGGFITKSSITVTLSGQENNVIYTCQATNDQIPETVTDTVTLSVLYPPGPPEITGYNENDIIKPGDRLQMSCKSTGGNPPASLEWYKGNDKLSSETETLGSTVRADVDVVTKRDDNNAIYTCKASNEATTVPLEALVKLTVYFKPEYVNVTAFPQVGKAGENLTLTCITASSNPPASITWVARNEQRKGKNMGTSTSTNGGMSTTNVLTIRPTYLDDEALYRCEARNLLIQESANDGITLSILYKPVFSHTLSPKQIEIIEGESQVVNYTAAANPKDVTYSLYKDGAQVSHFPIDKGMLKINSASRDNSGPYSIQATNSEGSDVYNFTLNVLYPAEIESITNPVAVDEEGTAFFECVAKANPNVDNMVVWSRTNFDMSKTKQTYTNGKGILTVFQLKREDAGAFICTADNRVGEPAVKEAQLIVKFSPMIDKSPQFAKSAGDEGSTVHMICSAIGAPKVTFKWTREGYDVTGEKYKIREDKDSGIYQSTLTVTEVTKAEYGTYVCTASNEKGEDTFSIQLDGTSRPDLPYDLEFVNATHETITISWKPGFNGGLDQWYIIRYKAANTQENTFIEIKNPHRTVFTIKGLQKGTSYSIAVFSENSKGKSGDKPVEITCKTADTAPSEERSLVPGTDDTPVIVIMVVCILGILLLALNIGLILYFVRRRKKRLENSSDTTSHTNTIELYGPSKETVLYPLPNHDDNRSYGTYEKNMDDLSDDYRNYEHGDEKSMHSSSCNCNCYQLTKSGHKKTCCLPPDSSGDEDIKQVFLPPPGYSSLSYTPSNMDSPQLTHQTYIPDEYIDDLDQPLGDWQYEDPYRVKGKGTFDGDYPDEAAMYDYNGYGPPDTRPKSVADYSDRSSSRGGDRSSSRGGGGRTPPPAPPVRSSSKGAAINYMQSQGPPLPDRNYDIDDLPPPNYNPSQVRYVPPPGSLGSFTSSSNIVTNPNYDGPPVAPSLPRTHQVAGDEMRGHLV